MLGVIEPRALLLAPTIVGAGTSPALAGWTKVASSGFRTDAYLRCDIDPNGPLRPIRRAVRAARRGALMRRRLFLASLVLALAPVLWGADQCSTIGGQYGAGVYDVGVLTLQTGDRLIGQGPRHTRLRGELVVDGGAGTVRDLIVRDLTFEGPVTLRRMVDSTWTKVYFEGSPFVLDSSWSNQFYASRWTDAPITRTGPSNANLFSGCRFSGALVDTPYITQIGPASCGAIVGSTFDGALPRVALRFEDFVAGCLIAGNHFEHPRAIEATLAQWGFAIVGNYFFAPGGGVAPITIADGRGISIHGNHGFQPSGLEPTALWECTNSPGNCGELDASGNMASGTMVVP